MNQKIGIAILLAVSGLLGVQAAQWAGWPARAQSELHWQLVCTTQVCYALDDSGNTYGLVADRIIDMGNLGSKAKFGQFSDLVPPRNLLRDKP